MKLLIENSIKEIKVGKYMDYIHKLLSQMEKGREPLAPLEVKAVLNHAKRRLAEKHPEDAEYINYAFETWWSHR